jgi:hypothetical protein
MEALARKHSNKKFMQGFTRSKKDIEASPDSYPSIFTRSRAREFRHAATADKVNDHNCRKQPIQCLAMLPLDGKILRHSTCFGLLVSVPGATIP